MAVTTAIDSGPKLRSPEKRVVQPKQRMQLVIVRHGETDWTLTGRYTGTSDVDLTANGRHEAATMSTLLQRVLHDQRAGSGLQSVATGHRDRGIGVA